MRSMRAKSSRICVGSADQAAHDAGFAQAAARDFKLDFGFAQAGGVGEDGAQARGVDWFLQEVVRAQLHGVDGEVDGAHGGEDDDDKVGLEAGAVFVEFGEQADAVHARHLEIGDDDVRVPGSGFIPAFDAVARGFSAVAPAGDELGKAHEGVGLVFDDENLYDVLHECSWERLAVGARSIRHRKYSFTTHLRKWAWGVFPWSRSFGFFRRTAVRWVGTGVLVSRPLIAIEPR